MEDFKRSALVIGRAVLGQGGEDHGSCWWGQGLARRPPEGVRRPEPLDEGLMEQGAEGGVQEALRVQPGYWASGGRFSAVGAWEEEQVEESWRMLGLAVGTELGASGISRALVF